MISVYIYKLNWLYSIPRPRQSDPFSRARETSPGSRSMPRLSKGTKGKAGGSLATLITEGEEERVVQGRRSVGGHRGARGGQEAKGGKARTESKQLEYRYTFLFFAPETEAMFVSSDSEVSHEGRHLVHRGARGGKAGGAGEELIDSGCPTSRCSGLQWILLVGAVEFIDFQQGQPEPGPAEQREQRGARQRGRGGHPEETQQEL